MRRGTRSDLAAEIFLALRKVFFDEAGTPVVYTLRPKNNVQDDPFDEFVADRLAERFAADNSDIALLRSPGPLVSPDLMIYRPSLVQDDKYLSYANDPAALLAVEVKNVARTRSGRVARASGMDFNTTPPCGTVRLHGSDGSPVDMRASYLFACQEQCGDSRYSLTALVLCDGDALNDDFGFYLSIVGARRKEAGLGSYGDGANRMRPMMIFGNPLGSPLFDRNITLIDSCDAVADNFTELLHAGTFVRHKQGNDKRTFYCYRHRREVAGSEPFKEIDPFPAPRRSHITTRRGRFLLPWLITGKG